MGSPIVFQTAPPQPASNARMTCPAVFVGGPEASQNGFGLVIPANLTVKSAMFTSTPFCSDRPIRLYGIPLGYGVLYRATSRGCLVDCAPRADPTHSSKPRAGAMPSA